jgi:DNA-binding transcriptional LysR family regulator
MQMELRHLRYFVAVAELLNFRRAAEKLHIAQSPLSHQVRQLEDELEVQLFARTKRRVYLTHAGTIFYEDARAILEKSLAAQERARRGAQGEEGSLTVGYLTSMASSHFSRIIKTFQQHFPRVRLVLNDLVPDAILKGLLDGTVDVGFMRGVLETEHLAVLQVWQEHLVVALPTNHRLAHKRQVRVGDLRKESFIMVPDKGAMGWNDLIRELCRSGGFTPTVAAEANQMQAVSWLVHVGLGIAIIPASLQGLRRRHVIYRQLFGSTTVPGMMVWHKDNDSPILQRFHELVVEATKTAPVS